MLPLARMAKRDLSAENEWTLITGGGSGLGLAFAQRCATAGERLILSGSDAKRLDEAAEGLRRGYGIEVRVFPRDLGLPEAGAGLAAAIAAAGCKVGCLINNAGFGLAGAFLEADAAEERRMLQVNVHAVIDLTRAVLPGMLNRGRGRILNVASTAAFQPGPWFAAYYASKAFVLSFSESLSEEVRNKGVTVTALCPGPIRTGFHRRAGVRETPWLRYASMDAARVADCGYRAMRRGRAVAVPGWGNRAAYWAVRLSPRAWVARFMSVMQKPR